MSVTPKAKNPLTIDQAYSLTKGAIVYRYQQAWLVTESAQTLKLYPSCGEGPHIRVRLGKNGHGGHEHWGWYEWYSLTPWSS